MSSGVRTVGTVAFAVLGLAVWVWTFGYPALRGPEGFLQGTACVGIAVGAGLLLIAVGIGFGGVRASLWAAMAVVGQAASLQLIAAGPLIRYQHYRVLGELVAAPSSYFVLVLLAQSLMVLVGIRRRWPQLVEQGRLVLERWAWFVCLAAMILTSATLSRDPVVYLTELAVAGSVQLVSLATVVLAVMALPDELTERLRRFGGRALGTAATPLGRIGIDRFALVTAGWVVLAALLLSVLSYERHPHLSDDVVYMIHAKYFAEGLLTMPPPPSIAAFDVHLMMYEVDRWYSPVPPGWPAMLAVGAYFGALWLVNPTLAGINTLLAYVLVRQLFGRRTARIALLLLAVSPWFILMAINYLTHTFTLTCGLLAAVAVARLRATGAYVWGWLGGAAIGATSLVRPLEGLAMAVVLGFWSLPLRGRRFRFGPVLSVAAAAVLVGGVQLWYNSAMTGDPGTFPIMAYTDSLYGPGTNALGFGANRGLGWGGLDPLPGHGPADVLINTNLNAFAVNIELLGWGAGSLVFAIILVLSGAMRKEDLFMLGWIGSVVGLHAFYYFSGGPDFGARYWFLIVVPAIVLTARGIEVVGGRLAAGAGSMAGVRSASVAVILSIAAAVNFFPWRAIDKYHHYRGMRADIRTLAREHNFARSLVFVRGPRIPDYASTVVYNPIDSQSDDPVYALFSDPDVKTPVLDAFPDRLVWIVDGPTRTGAGYRVVAGPLSHDEMRGISF